MAIPTRGLNSIRTLSGRVDRISLPYRSYMAVTCLEMEKARRGMERQSASQRVALIDARIADIDKAEKELLRALAAPDKIKSERLPGIELKPTPRRSAGGFKIRY